MLLCKCDKSCRSQLAMCTISVHSYCNKRGQTSRLVAKAQIQTSYNFEKNLFKCDSYLDYVCFRHIILLLESFFHFMVGTYWQRPVSIHLSFFVHKIFCTLRHNQIHIQHHGSLRQPSQATPLNIPRYRKAVTNALWVQVTMTFCYLPYRIVEILRPQIGLSSSLYLSIQFTANLVLFKNSSLNPLLYCWKIREVRQAVKDTIRQFFCAQN